MNPKGKYRPFRAVVLDDRMWPSRTIVRAPSWSSVDLRDGNQALPIPMIVLRKIEIFELLVKCGLKEIEIGFPAASQTEYAFGRRLIEEKRIPDDVTIQVLVQAREDLIARTVLSLYGARRVIIHLYNSTSPIQREIVFGLKKQEIIELAVRGTRWVRHYSASLQGTEVLFQYSPESFSATEVDFSVDICDAVMAEWKATPERKLIINLPNTVEVATPNAYADQIEWFCRHMARRDSAIISVHTHNDRGTGVAATELGLLAGAERVEGTLFGNGERTGNVDLVTVALNLYAQGIDPGLDFSDLAHIREVYERCTGMTVPTRQPYSGDLVYTAFSGSHQDAIRKGFRARNDKLGTAEVIPWEIPYLAIDPEDIGRHYNEVIRVNGQSGKGGMAYLLERECGIYLPKDMQREFAGVAGKIIDERGCEATSADLKAMLWSEYIERAAPYSLESFESIGDIGTCRCSSEVRFGDGRFALSGVGNGPIDAFIRSLPEAGMADVQVLDQHEHALGIGSESKAISYIQLRFPDGVIRWGAGVDTSIQVASIRAVVCALNRKY